MSIVNVAVYLPLDSCINSQKHLVQLGRDEVGESAT